MYVRLPVRSRSEWTACISRGRDPVWVPAYRGGVGLREALEGRGEPGPAVIRVGGRRGQGHPVIQPHAVILLDQTVVTLNK